MGQRLSRAKAKIKSKSISYSIPDAEMWQDRLETVLTTLYLIFTTGYVNEDESARDLCREGLFLARLLRQLRPDEPEIEGAFALMLLTEARRPARISDDGALVPIEEQDISLWHQGQINEAQGILERAVEQRHAGPFQVKAAIADCHMMRPTPDWRQMSLLYRTLWAFEPTPVVALNWAVVIAETGQVEFALERLNALKPDLEEFQPWHTARAHVLDKLDRKQEASEAFQRAIQTAPNVAARKLLEQKRRNLMH